MRGAFAVFAFGRPFAGADLPPFDDDSGGDGDEDESGCDDRCWPGSEDDRGCVAGDEEDSGCVDDDENDGDRDSGLGDETPATTADRVGDWCCGGEALADVGGVEKDGEAPSSSEAVDGEADGRPSSRRGDTEPGGDWLPLSGLDAAAAWGARSPERAAGGVASCRSR